MDQLEEIALRFQVYLEGLKTNEFTEFNRVLQDIGDNIQRELAAGELSEMSRTRMEQLLRRVSRDNRLDIDDYMEDLSQLLKNFAVYSYEFEAQAIVTASTVSSVSSRVAEEAAWRAAATRPLSATGEMLEPWLDKLKTNQVAALENLIRRAHSEGWSNNTIMKALRGTRTNGFKDGLFNKLGSSNATVIRTAVQHINSAVRMKVWEDNDDMVKGYRWVSTLDRKTTAQCRSLDGQVFELGKGPLPPIHPNCRSTIIAVLDDVFDVFDVGATRSSENGRVPANMDYYEWLKTQPASFQDVALGPVRGVLFRNGGLSASQFSALQLNNRFEPLTLAEMRKLKPLAFERAGI